MPSARPRVGCSQADIVVSASTHVRHRRQSMVTLRVLAVMFVALMALMLFPQLSLWLPSVLIK
jgi:TRAP-type C4-dicarboxylate transport system permease large subunit